MMDGKGTVVLLSGGMDSTVAAFWAQQTFGRPLHVLGIEYNQRHWIELTVNTARRIRVCSEAGADSIDGSGVSRFGCQVAPLTRAAAQPGLPWH